MGLCFSRSKFLVASVCLCPFPLWDADMCSLYSGFSHNFFIFSEILSFAAFVGGMPRRFLFPILHLDNLFLLSEVQTAPLFPSPPSDLFLSMPVPTSSLP